MGLPVGFLFPEEDATPQRIQSWRWKVAGSLMVLWVVAGFNLAAMFTGLPKVGQLVWADGISNKADKQEVSALIVQNAQTQATLVAIQESLNESLAQAKASEIRAAALKRCAAPANSAERESLTREIDRLQTDYKKIKGEVYDKPSCGEL